jgi:putative hydrolase of the HAD superfamily
MNTLPPVIFLDAAGTLIQVQEPVAAVYQRIAQHHGVQVDGQALVWAFRSAWQECPPPLHELPPVDDDRGWWRALVAKTFALAKGRPLDDLVLEPLFDELYQHYAQPRAWMVYDEVPSLLRQLHEAGHRLYVLSNFDKRLRAILNGHDLSRWFQGMIISSEVGASKPHRRIFEAAMNMAGARPEQCLHIGDDASADVAGAEALGIRALHVRRPETTLRDLLKG